MPTMWRKAMLYLGLAPEEEYDDYDAAYDDGYVDAPPARRGAPSPPVQVPDIPEPSAIGAVRAIRTVDSPDLGPSAIVPTPRPQVVRPIPVASNAKPHVVTPISFNEAQEVADKFKGNQPVIMNLQGADRDLARRLIDFASGLCYGVGGQMEKVANQVYLLTPSNVEVSVEERRRLQERGFSDR
jgi:cell division inhibitor SepF